MAVTVPVVDEAVRIALASLDHVIQPDRNEPSRNRILEPLRAAVAEAAANNPDGAIVALDLPTSGARWFVVVRSAESEQHPLLPRLLP